MGSERRSGGYPFSDITLNSGRMQPGWGGQMYLPSQTGRQLSDSPILPPPPSYALLPMPVPEKKDITTDVPTSSETSSPSVGLESPLVAMPGALSTRPEISIVKPPPAHIETQAEN